jgi:transmembrane sensor
MNTQEDSVLIEQTASRYIAQRETGPWTDADAHALQHWLSRSTLHRVIYYRLNAAWQEAGRLKALSAPMVASRKSHPIWRAGGVLAATVAVAGVCIGAWHLWFNGDPYVTGVGGLQTVALDDGSKLTLNTDSRARVRFDKGMRRVDLDRGEAYFEVARDSSRPFVVYAGRDRVIAIGTAFTVRRTAGDVQVAVSEGTVAVASGTDPDPTLATTIHVGDVHEGKSVLLAAGSIAEVAGKSILVQQKKLADIEDQISWRNGVLRFHETPLGVAVAEFNRYNSRKILIRDAVINDIRIGGIFGATQPEVFTHLLERGMPIQVSQEGNNLILDSR